VVYGIVRPHPLPRPCVPLRIPCTSRAQAEPLYLASPDLINRINAITNVFHSSDDETGAPNQVLINEYERGQGISVRLDLPFS
jgi:alkylated DNA repair dioxygenase AlkB